MASCLRMLLFLAAAHAVNLMYVPGDNLAWGSVACTARGELRQGTHTAILSGMLDAAWWRCASLRGGVVTRRSARMAETAVPPTPDPVRRPRGRVRGRGHERGRAGGKAAGAVVPSADGAGEDSESPDEGEGDKVMQENSGAEESVEDGVDEEGAQEGDNEDENGDEAAAVSPTTLPERRRVSEDTPGGRIVPQSIQEVGKTRADVQHPRDSPESQRHPVATQRRETDAAREGADSEGDSEEGSEGGGDEPVDGVEWRGLEGLVAEARRLFSRGGKSGAVG